MLIDWVSIIAGVLAGIFVGIATSYSAINLYRRKK